MKKFLLIIFSSIFIVGCGQKYKDIDLSNLPKPKKINFEKEEKQEVINNKDKSFITDLSSFKTKEQVISDTKLGKIDPFSDWEMTHNINKLSEEFKLTGFLRAENIKYVFVSYLDIKGTITEGSIGGVNTNLLPNGAKVIKIDDKNKKLTINFEDKNYEFEL